MTDRNATRRYLGHVGLLALGGALGQVFLVIGLTELGYAEQTVRLFGTELRQLGLLISAPTAAAAIGGLWLWRWTIRVGGRTALMTAALLQALALASFALLPPWPWLAAGLAISGPAGVLLSLNAAPTMLKIARDEDATWLFARAAATALAATAAGQALAGVIVNTLTAAGNGLTTIDALRWAAAGGAILSGAAALPLSGLRLSERAAVDERTPAIQFSLQQHLAQLPAAIRLAIGPLLTSIGAALFVPYLGVYLRTHYTISDQQLGFIFATITLTTGIATLIGPRLALRVGRIDAVLWTQTPAIAVLLLFPLAPSIWFATLLAALRSGLMNLAGPLYEVEVTTRAAESLRPTQVAVLRGAGSAGFLIGPTLSLALQAEIGFPGVMAVTAALYAAGVAATWLLVRRPAALVQSDEELRRAAAKRGAR